MQQETGDYPAAAASQQQALALFGDLGFLLGQAYALNDLGLVQQETGDYPAAAASHQQAFELFQDLGDELGQAEALNRLGELSLADRGHRPIPERHAHALAIARRLKAPLEEARALEGLGQSTPARRRPWPSRPAAAAGTHDLPAHRRPRRTARAGNPPEPQADIHHPGAPASSSQQ